MPRRLIGAALAVVVTLLALSAGAHAQESTAREAECRPIAFAKWTAEGAPRGLRAAERKAVLIHVSDRDRSESTG